MLPNKAKQTLAANLRLLSGGTDTQAFRERIAKKTGGEVSARTIGTMMSSTAGNPTLANVEAVATALNMTVAELLTENLGRNKQGAAGASVAAEAASAADASLSPAARAVIERICAAEGAGASSPQLLQAIEAVLDLAHPRASAGGYSGLDNLHAE